MTVTPLAAEWLTRAGYGTDEQSLNNLFAKRNEIRERAFHVDSPTVLPAAHAGLSDAVRELNLRDTVAQCAAEVLAWDVALRAAQQAPDLAEEQRRRLAWANQPNFNTYADAFSAQEVREKDFGQPRSAWSLAHEAAARLFAQKRAPLVIEGLPAKPVASNWPR